MADEEPQPQGKVEEELRSAAAGDEERDADSRCIPRLYRQRNGKGLIQNAHVYLRPYPELLRVNREKRLVALVRQVDISPPSRHTVGLPVELTGEVGGSTPLPEARVLILEVAPDESLLWRYSSLGEFAGDTWHQNDLDAVEQAELEYGTRVGSWIEYPVKLTHEQVLKAVLGDVGGK